MTKLYEPGLGHISKAAQEMVDLAIKERDDVVAVFNGVPLLATAETKPEAIVAVFQKAMDEGHAEYERKQAIWRTTPEGIEATRKQAEQDARAKALQDGPLPTFALADAEHWKHMVEVNNDGYGSACIRYAAYWAHLMEAAMAKGANVADVQDVAKQCSHDADVEGITGFMYGASVAILAKCWKHGEELRRWHNKSSQIGTEGDKANESGGVLNPALMTIETKE